MKVLLFLVLSVAPSLSFAVTDFACQARCMQNGSNMQFCTNQCSTSDSQGSSWSSGVYQPTQPMKQTDFPCLNACTARGMLYSVCQDKCSY